MPDTDTAAAPKPKRTATIDEVARATAESTRPASKLAKLGLHRDVDLVLHLPMRYEDETTLPTIAEATTRANTGWITQVEGTVTRNEVAFRLRRQFIVHIADDSGELVLRFLNFYGSQVRQMAEGVRLRVRGEVRGGFFGAEMVHPAARAVVEDEPLSDRLTPMYPSTAGVAQAYLRKAILNAFAHTPLSEMLPNSLITGPLAPLKLMTPTDAVRLLHQPAPDVDEHSLVKRTHPAWLHTKFDELLSQQLPLKRAQAARRMRNASILRDSGKDGLLTRFMNTLPFKLIGAQARMWDEIHTDLAHPYPIQRLLQGNVDGGKTVVATLAACQAIDAGWQAMLMAPTELLVERHYRKLSARLEPLGMNIVWLAGSLKHKQKDEAVVRAAADTTQLVIGTHALIQDAVTFARLGLAVVDEQHRSGVAQRLALRGKTSDGNASATNVQVPHQLMMSTTPIPRMLAMTYYTDLDVSAIDELPPGRTPIVTRLVNDARRDEVIECIYAAVREGRQVYWVCLLIEESEMLQLQTAVETFETLSQSLQGLKVDLMHGRLPSARKAAVMSTFADGDLHVLVATTAIEMGVDVPNTSLMVIEYAEHFGLAQLHQLRGRVGRGTAEFVCVLLHQAPLSPTAKQHLQTMRETADGFEIARHDLETRGPGEFLDARRLGEAMLCFTDLNRDAWSVEFAQGAADAILVHFPEAVDTHPRCWLGEREHYLRV